MVKRKTRAGKAAKEYPRKGTEALYTGQRDGDDSHLVMHDMLAAWTLDKDAVDSNDDDLDKKLARTMGLGRLSLTENDRQRRSGRRREKLRRRMARMAARDELRGLGAPSASAAPVVPQHHVTVPVVPIDKAVASGVNPTGHTVYAAPGQMIKAKAVRRRRVSGKKRGQGDDDAVDRARDRQERLLTRLRSAEVRAAQRASIKSS